MARSFYSEERGCFIFVKKGTRSASADVLLCMHILSNAPHYMCSLMGIVQRQKSQLGLFIRKGGEYDKKHTITLLETLSTHKCTACVGGQFALAVLVKRGLTITEPTNCPYGRQKAKLLPPAATPSEPRMYVTPRDLLQSVASSGKCVYLTECEKFLQSLGMPCMSSTHYVAS